MRRETLGHCLELNMAVFTKVLLFVSVIYLESAVFNGSSHSQATVRTTRQRRLVTHWSLLMYYPSQAPGLLNIHHKNTVLGPC
jgi:hypothetical protein